MNKIIKNPQQGSLEDEIFKSVGIKYFLEFKESKVLILDDIEDDLNKITEILNPFSFEILGTVKVSWALRLLRKNKFDIILVDISNPRFLVDKFIKKIKANELNMNASIIFMSSTNAFEHKIQSYRLGSLGYIEKPFEPNSVRVQIYGVLKLKQLQAELMEEKENFITMLTHDMRTPLRAQITAIQLLLKGNFGGLTKTQRTILENVVASNEYMENMAENVLMKYKFQKDEFKLELRIHDIKRIIQDVIEKMHHVFLQKGLVARVSHNLQPCYVMADETEIKRVLVNFLMNATEYSYENGEIVVSVRVNDDKVQVSVRDFGMGLKNIDVSKIFDKKNIFNKEKLRKIGSGLGLYISKQIVLLHNGKIFAKKNSEKGATFSFVLPLAKKDATKN